MTTQPPTTTPARSIEVGPQTRSRGRSGDAAFGTAELVAAARRDEEWAWVALVERYRGLVSSITWSYHLRSEDAAEVGQIVWLRLLESIHELRDTDRISGWIRTVTSNECHRVFLRYRREVVDMDAATLDHQSDETVWGALLAEERRAALRRAVARLHGKGRVLLETVLAEPGMTYAELAARLEMARGSVGPIRQRSLTALRSAPELAGLAG